MSAESEARTDRALARLAEAAPRAPRISAREARAVRKICERRGRLLASEVDAGGVGHRVVVVTSRRPGGERFVCDLPAEGAARLVGVFRGEGEGDGRAALTALVADYRERLALEERPICRPVRLRELAGRGEVSDGGEDQGAPGEGAGATRRRVRAGLGLESGLEGPVRFAG